METLRAQSGAHPQVGSFTCYPEHLFNLKFAAKELQRNSKKCDKEEKIEKNKVKKVRSSGPGRLVSCGVGVFPEGF